jgi:hypothetical protein
VSAVRIVVVLYGALYVGLGVLRSPGDGDLWWQHWLGNVILDTHRLPSSLGSETFTAAGAHWVPQEWIFSVLVAFSMTHGIFWALQLLVALIPTVIFLSIYERARRSAAPEAIAMILVLSGNALAESFGIRAQVAGWGCMAIFLMALERRDKWSYAAIPIAAMWANLHASAMVAPAIVLARLTGTAIDGGFQGLRVSRELRIFPFSLIALLCTPFGWRLPAYAIALAGSPIRHFIQEWQPVHLSDYSFTAGSLAIVVLLIFPDPRRIIRCARESLPVAMLLIATIMASRNIPLLSILAAPLAARNLSATAPWLRKIGEKAREMEPVAHVAIFVAVSISAWYIVWYQAREPQSLPRAAMSSLAADPGRHRVFCEDFAWCSVALQFPNLQVYIDGRCDPYPLSVWESYVSIITIKPSWREELRQYRVNAVVAGLNSRLARKLGVDSHWHVSFRDAKYVVYLRG